MKWIRGARYNSRDVSSAEAGPGGHKALLAVGGLRMHAHTALALVLVLNWRARGERRKGR
jgi:hypothetical protein